MIVEKRWFESKTKWAAILIGLAPVLTTLGGMLNGHLDIGSGVFTLASQVGVVLAVFGIRDIPMLNKK